jgi:hypothetical protein
MGLIRRARPGLLYSQLGNPTEYMRLGIFRTGRSSAFPRFRRRHTGHCYLVIVRLARVIELVFLRVHTGAVLRVEEAQLQSWLVLVVATGRCM